MAKTRLVKLTVMDANEKRAALYLRHPNDCPEIVGRLSYLIHPPGKLSSTSRWRDFRERTLLPLLRDRPDDPNLPRFLKQTDAVLAWRATVPPEMRFWKAD